MSGDEAGGPLVALPAALGVLLGALATLTAPGMPAVAVIGGTGVNIRLSTSDAAHRATPDIDVVADEHDPTAIELLARGNEQPREHTVIVDGVEVDVIPTFPVTDDVLAGIDDGPRLFVAGHRWALETATPVRLTVPAAGAAVVAVPVGSAAGLVAAKSHAAGYPRPDRRANKHAGDLYDLFRLLEVFDAGGRLRAELAGAPGGLGRLVAKVIRGEVLASPARAMRQMARLSPTALDVDRVVDVFEPFVEDLDPAGS